MEPTVRGDPGRTIADVIFDYERGLLEHYVDDPKLEPVLQVLADQVLPLLGSIRVGDVDTFLLQGYARLLAAHHPRAVGILKNLSHAFAWEGQRDIALTVAAEFWKLEHGDG